MQYPNGMYVSANFSERSQLMLASVMEELKVENRVPLDKLHVTILYSDTPIEFDLFGDKTLLNPPLCVHPVAFDAFDEGNVLALKLTQAQLQTLHNLIVMATGAVHGYLPYVAHVTLSYDCDCSRFLAIDPAELFLEPLELVSIRAEHRNPEWEHDLVPVDA